MASIEELEFVREVLDNVITGAVDPSEVVAALEIVTGMLGEQDVAAEAENSPEAESQDDVSADESLPSDAASAE